MNLEEEIRKAAAVMQTWGIMPERTRLVLYNAKQWGIFVEQNKDHIPGLIKEQEGLFIPKALRAYVRTNSRFLVTHAFHEFFGHGAYCEHSFQGQELVQIGIKEEDEQVYLADTHSKKWGLHPQRIGDFEGFALWVEGFLCEATGNTYIWEEKLAGIQERWQQLHRLYAKAAKRFTTKGFLKQMGFSIQMKDEEIVNVLQELYGGAWNDVEMALIAGSESPESDLDIYVIRKGQTQDWNTGWLDVGEFNADDFLARLVLKDVATVTPLYEGRPIYDPKGLFAHAKNTTEETSITEEAIAHAEQNIRKMESFQGGEEHTCIALSYAKSHAAQARALRQGITLHTREERDAFLNSAHSKEFSKIRRGIT